MAKTPLLVARPCYHDEPRIRYTHVSNNLSPIRPKTARVCVTQDFISHCLLAHHSCIWSTFSSIGYSQNVALSKRRLNGGIEAHGATVVVNTDFKGFSGRLEFLIGSRRWVRPFRRRGRFVDSRRRWRLVDVRGWWWRSQKRRRLLQRLQRRITEKMITGLRMSEKGRTVHSRSLSRSSWNTILFVVDGISSSWKVQTISGFSREKIIVESEILELGESTDPWRHVSIELIMCYVELLQ